MDQGTQELDAVYYDTDDLRLASASATLRRRTGGADAGWHLKLPLSGDSREEVQAPLSDTVPDTLRDLALSRSRGAELRPVVRIRSTRGVRQLVGSGTRAHPGQCSPVVVRERSRAVGQAWRQDEREQGPAQLGMEGDGHAVDPSGQQTVDEAGDSEAQGGRQSEELTHGTHRPRPVGPVGRLNGFRELRT
ncbi:CYTH domain-containing protein [Streptomyces sp. NPDC048254]|uniref:CYTH domain-containing protein n=1 Tax=Streptomyces sp. NPDC048254 TaxID=3365525 RepID=UPI003717D17D